MVYQPPLLYLERIKRQWVIKQVSYIMMKGYAFNLKKDTFKNIIHIYHFLVQSYRTIPTWYPFYYSNYFETIVEYLQVYRPW